jgi:enoyl-CoA hydratase/carnithine racemase
MPQLSTYQNKYKFIRLERRQGILQIMLHKNGGPATWSYKTAGGLHEELGECFYQVGRDVENRVVILTGTGDHFLLPDDQGGLDSPGVSPLFWDRLYRESQDLTNNFLDIPTLVISAVNGPAYLHAELLCMSDIVIAADTAYFADYHVRAGAVPGDGSHIWWPILLGPNLGRQFLLTGMQISASEGKRLGFVAEVTPSALLLERAWAVAAELAAKPDLTIRYTRVAFTQHMKRRLHDDLGYGLMLEAMGSLHANRPNPESA